MTREISNYHNNFFTRFMGSKEVAKEFLKMNLSEEVLNKFDLDTLKESGNSYVNDELKALFSDVVFTVNFKDGQKGFISFLLEHKSSPEKKTVLQLLKYLIRIWDKEYENEKVLPLVLPVVFYHGSANWNQPVKFSGLFKNNPKWAEYFTPEFGFYLYTLDDLTEKMSDIDTAKFRIMVKVLSLKRVKTKMNF